MTTKTTSQCEAQIAKADRTAMNSPRCLEMRIVGYCISHAMKMNGQDGPKHTWTS